MNATYHTHYTNHKDERCEILEEVSASAVKVRFTDGAVEFVPASSLIRD